ncbi:MAG TPA: hypothetical protein VIB48_17695 [Acidimicrobiia bacterium]|jgi:hypothetical protein
MRATALRAAVLYPSGGLLDTGLWTADRNRPGRFAVEGVKDDRFIISYGLDETREMLHQRADAIGEGRLRINLSDLGV